ncbi:ferredoxin [Streptomyces sp. DSM 44917]|uniref:Ferredoxin n=1 Tax=Streptomyces boetiae TaxID=3075541 RepID=A0ABU2LC12_9ACTN|nr:ferredoxin [Streptomyces sp. DSM 44917]MDT0309126.1 ferredoxin [Streptomyces sp. DSM 44917]
MEIRIHPERCLSAGMCALTAPGVFDQDEEIGAVVLLEADPPPERHDLVRRAADSCPNGAITVLDGPPDAAADASAQAPGARS